MGDDVSRSKRAAKDLKDPIPGFIEGVDVVTYDPLLVKAGDDHRAYTRSLRHR